MLESIFTRLAFIAANPHWIIKAPETCRVGYHLVCYSHLSPIKAFINQELTLTGSIVINVVPEKVHTPPQKGLEVPGVVEEILRKCIKL